MMKHVAFILPGEHHSHRGVGYYARDLSASINRVASTHNLVVTPLMEIHSENYDLVHYTHFDLFHNTLPLFSRQKSIVSVLDVIPLEASSHYPPGIKGSFNLLLQKLALKRADKVITISQYSKRSISRYLNIHPDKIEVTLLAPSPPIFKQITNSKLLESTRRKYALPEKFVLYVGDVNWNKNLPNLTLATQMLGVHLVIVGKTAKEIMGMANRRTEIHPELDAAYKWADKFHGNKLIHTLGFVPDTDLVNIYNLATVYCQPSFLEGFGMPLLQSLACGTPSVSSNTSSLPEIGGDAVNYFDPHNVKNIAQTLNGVYSSSKLRDRLKQAGLKRSKLFSWNSTAARTLEIYLKLLKK